MALPFTPTSSLPPVGRLSTYSLKQITDALANIRGLYFPTKLSLPIASVKPAKKARHHLLHDTSVPDSGYASAEEEDEVQEEDAEEALELLRADEFERSFAVRWLTGLTARADTFLYPATPISEEEEEQRTATLEDAATLLSAFAGGLPEDLADEDLARQFTFSSAGGPVSIVLTDAQLLANDHTSVGLQSWASSIIFAERICATPAAFGLATPTRVLELGAGTGLLSLTVARLFGTCDSDDKTGAIVATDFHPDVLANLEHNVKANFPSAPEDVIAVHRLDWSAPDWTVAPLEQPFDVLLAADVVYEPAHAGWIHDCVAHALGPEGIFWMILAQRGSGRHAGLVEAVGNVFPIVEDVKPTTEPALAVLMQEDIGRVQGCGRADEDSYRLYKIGWVKA